MHGSSSISGSQPRTFRLSFMFLATAICMPVKGLVVPRSSDTVVDLAGAAAGAGAAAALAGAAAAGAAAAGAGAEGAAAGEGKACQRDAYGSDVLWVKCRHVALV
jgi:hypothetical protein